MNASQKAARPCSRCKSTRHADDAGHFREAFTNAVTGEPHSVPDEVKSAATRITIAYGLRGISDPMYIANVIAKELGYGDGQSTFWVREA